VNPPDAEAAAWMRLALLEAQAALDAGDVPVGAVVVDPLGAVVGSGRNRRVDDGDPTAHAEILALRGAARTLGSSRLDGCTLVSTLEPCPMCAGAAIVARVARVLFGAWDPKAGAAGSVWDLLRDRRSPHRPEVRGGIAADAAGDLLKTFFADLR
jgi:tRNA(adenine34) deaminase